METVPFVSFMREKIQLRIEKRVEALQKGYRQNVGILGPCGIGKSRLLASVYESFPRRPDLIPVFIDARTIDFDDLAERWTGAILAGYLAACMPAVPADYQALLIEAESRIPKTVEKVRRFKKQIRHEKNAAAVREMFSLLASLPQETGKKVVVIIDEFQELNRLPAPDPFALLGREIMVTKDVLYLVSSSTPHKAREIFREKLSLLFGNFEIIELKTLEFGEVSEYLGRRLPDAQFSDRQRKFLILMTDGHPTYLSLIAERLEGLLGAGFKGEVPDDALVGALHAELLEGGGRIASLFQRRLEACRHLGKDNALYLRVLLAAGEGPRKISHIAAGLHKNTLETQKILQRLVQEDFLARYGNFYSLEDFLFRFWLVQDYKPRQASWLPDDRMAGGRMERVLWDCLNGIRTEGYEDLLQRTEKLLLSFRNDVVEMQGKKVHCPQFSEVVFRPTGGRFLTLLGRGARERWLCQIARGLVREEDVALLADESKRFRKKIRNVILIALAGIEQNAKLMAQEANIQIWGLRRYNAFLDLFGESKVILTEDDLRAEQHEPNVGALAQSLHTA